MRTLALVAVAWLLLAALGLSVLAHVPPRLRGRLLPAAPVVGVALAVAVLHASTAVTGADVGAVLLSGVAVLLAVTATRRYGRRAWVVARRDVAVAGLVAVASLVPLGTVLAPSLEVGGGVVQPTQNNDAFYYVTLASWLRDEPGVQAPVIASEPSAQAAPPSYGPVASHVRSHLRLGESLVQAGLNVALRTDERTSWFPLTALWVALAVGSTCAAVRLLRLPVLAGLATGLVVAVHPLVLQQAYNQNSASLLGTALAPLALVAVHTALDREPAVPRWLAALLLVGWLGTYTEYAVLGVPALALAALLRRPAAWLPALHGAAVVLGLALVMAPLVWLNGLRSVAVLSAVTADGRTSPFLDVTGWQALNRASGVAPLTGGDTATRAAPILVALVVAGVLLALGLDRRRGLWAGVAVAAVAVVARWTLLDPPSPYTQQRVVELAMPLVLLSAGVGYAALVQRGLRVGREGSGGRAAGAATTAVALVAGTYAGSVFLRTDDVIASLAVEEPRHVDADFSEAARWVDELGGPEGRDVAVLAGEFYQQLWIGDALSEFDEVSYPVLDASYYVVERHWAGEANPLVLVDTATWVDADPGVVVRSNDRFRLLDLTRGDAVAATALGFSLVQWYYAEPGPRQWLNDGGRLAVLRSEGAPPDVALRLRANPDAAAAVALQVGVVGADHQAAGPTAVTVPPAGEVVVQVPLPAGPGALLTLDAVEPPLPAPSLGLDRPRSVELLDVGRGR